MNVEMPELLRGAFLALAEPPPEGSGPEFMAGTVGVIGLLALLASQESEHGAAIRVAENEALEDLLRRARAEGWPGVAPATLEGLLSERGRDLSLTGLEARNAALKSVLIELQIAGEDQEGPEGRARERAIMDLLAKAARARQVRMPQEPAPL